jgi:hypothetical protein
MLIWSGSGAIDLAALQHKLRILVEVWSKGSGCVDAAPTAKPPRQTPSRAGWRPLRHVVDPGGPPRLAAQQPRQRHPAAAPQTESLDCLVGVHRAGRQMAAVVADQRRQGVLIDPDRAASGVARESHDRAGAIGTAPNLTEGRVLHGRCAEIMCVDLRGSGAWNQPMRANATHPGKYRMVCAPSQQKLYGRRNSSKLPFS